MSEQISPMSVSQRRVEAHNLKKKERRKSDTIAAMGISVWGFKDKDFLFSLPEACK